jgi:hypothetical protein
MNRFERAGDRTALSTVAANTGPSKASAGEGPARGNSGHRCAQMPPDHSSITFHSFLFAIEGQNEKKLPLSEYEGRREETLSMLH